MAVSSEINDVSFRILFLSSSKRKFDLIVFRLDIYMLLAG